MFIYIDFPDSLKTAARDRPADHGVFITKFRQGGEKIAPESFLY
jgi:hypothetical protein